MSTDVLSLKYNKCLRTPPTCKHMFECQTSVFFSLKGAHLLILRLFFRSGLMWKRSS